MKPFPDTSVEKIVYAAVEEVATREPNDRERLAYTVLRWLENKDCTLEDAIRHSRIRLDIPVSQTVEVIRRNLGNKGIVLPP